MQKLLTTNTMFDTEIEVFFFICRLSCLSFFSRIFQFLLGIKFMSRKSPTHGDQFRKSKVQYYFDFVFPFLVHVWIYQTKKKKIPLCTPRCVHGPYFVLNCRLIAFFNICLCRGEVNECLLRVEVCCPHKLRQVGYNS